MEDALTAGASTATGSTDGVGAGTGAGFVASEVDVHPTDGGESEVGPDGDNRSSESKGTVAHHNGPCVSGNNRVNTAVVPSPNITTGPRRVCDHCASSIRSALDKGMASVLTLERPSPIVMSNGVPLPNQTRLRALRGHRVPPPYTPYQQPSSSHSHASTQHHAQPG